MAAPSPAAVVGPCIERILAAATGRKYAKLRQDAQVRAGGCFYCVAVPAAV